MATGLSQKSRGPARKTSAAGKADTVTLNDRPLVHRGKHRMTRHIKERLSCKAAISALALLPVQQFAFADPVEFEASAGVSSMLIDRGETLAKFNNEISLTIAQPASLGTLYGSVYRITPLGDDKTAFDEEVDYTIGMSFEGDALSLDVSVNRLTFPGSTEDAATELVAEIGAAHMLNAALTTFYDVDADAFGSEASIAPSKDYGNWSLGLLLRGGFVSTGDGDYSYAGVETNASRALSDLMALEAFARFEFADEDNFVSRVDSGNVLETTAEGLAIGVRLTVSG